MPVEVGADAAPGPEAPSHARSARIPGAILALLGAAIALEANGFEVSFLTDPLGPKALPYLAALALTVAGLSLARRPGTAPRWPTRARLARMGLGSAALIAYALLLPWLGFMLATTLVVTALAHLFGAPPLRGATAAAALAFALWLVFVWTLALQLPVGALWTR